MAWQKKNWEARLKELENIVITNGYYDVKELRESVNYTNRECMKFKEYMGDKLKFYPTKRVFSMISDVRRIRPIVQKAGHVCHYDIRVALNDELTIHRIKTVIAEARCLDKYGLIDRKSSRIMKVHEWAETTSTLFERNNGIKPTYSQMLELWGKATGKGKNGLLIDERPILREYSKDKTTREKKTELTEIVGELIKEIDLDSTLNKEVISWLAEEHDIHIHYKEMTAIFKKLGIDRGGSRGRLRKSLIRNINILIEEDPTIVRYPENIQNKLQHRFNLFIQPSEIIGIINRKDYDEEMKRIGEYLDTVWGMVKISTDDAGMYAMMYDIEYGTDYHESKLKRMFIRVIKAKSR